MAMRALSELTVDDLIECPVWDMVSSETSADLLVKPVKQFPLGTLRNRLIGTQLRLADGSPAWALLGNISLKHAKATKHFITVSVYRAGKWFDLARYHDADYTNRDAVALARFLSKAVTEVFPFRYDISAVATGAKEALSNQVHALPQERLDQDELISLSLDAEC